MGETTFRSRLQINFQSDKQAMYMLSVSARRWPFADNWVEPYIPGGTASLVAQLMYSMGG